jgi:hypothetical protein
MASVAIENVCGCLCVGLMWVLERGHEVATWSWAWGPSSLGAGPGRKEPPFHETAMLSPVRGHPEAAGVEFSSMTE